MAEVIKNHTIETVNQRALDRLYELLDTAGPEIMPDLIECLAKYNTSIRNNSIFAAEPDADELREAEQAEILRRKLGENG